MQSIRHAFKSAFDQLGGGEALAAWGRANPTEFYKLAARLIPVELAGSRDQPIQIVTRAE